MENKCRKRLKDHWRPFIHIRSNKCNDLVYADLNMHAQGMRPSQILFTYMSVFKFFRRAYII